MRGCPECLKELRDAPKPLVTDRQAYVMAAEIMQSTLWDGLDNECREAVRAATAEGVVWAHKSRVQPEGGDADGVGGPTRSTDVTQGEGDYDDWCDHEDAHLIEDSPADDSPYQSESAPSPDLERVRELRALVPEMRSASTLCGPGEEKELATGVALIVDELCAIIERLAGENARLRARLEEARKVVEPLKRERDVFAGRDPKRRIIGMSPYKDLSGDVELFGKITKSHLEAAARFIGGER
jgi:hypothetical protein